MKWPGFAGPSYTPRSINVDAERCINLYPEFVESGVGVVKTWLVGTPGLRSYVGFTVDLGGPVRALWSMNGRAFAVIGQGFYEFFASQRGKRWGSMAVDDDPATICSNGTAGNQIFITSAGHGYIFRTDTNTFAEITDPNFPSPCSHGLFVDGYFVGLLKHSRQFRISALLDGTDWNGLDVAEMSWSADDLRAIVASHREVWCFGEHNTQIWYDSGNPSFPFQPISGVLIEHGILAPYSAVNLDNTIYWLGSDPLGTGVVWKANGYTPQRISTHAVEYWLQQRAHLNRAIGYAYQEEGHSFYVLYVPDSGTLKDEVTWVYDVATGLWHERATWNEDVGRWEPHEGRCHCYAFGRNFVGGRTSGQIYEQALDLYDEDVSTLNSVIEVASPSAAPGDPVIPDIARALWFGYTYSASQRYGYNTDAIPQNVLFVEDATAVAWGIAEGYDLVVSPLTADVWTALTGLHDRVVALYTSGTSAGTLATAVAAVIAARPADLADRPILGICDGFMPTSAITGVDWLGVQCYTLTTESADQCQARVEAALAILDAAHPLALIGLSETADTTYTQDETDLEFSQVIPGTIAASDLRVQMILMHSDGRPTGTQDHEEWRPLHQAVYDTITGKPALSSTSISPSVSESASPSLSASTSASSSVSPSSTVSPSESPSLSTSSSVSPSSSESPTSSTSASASESISSSLSESASPSGAP